MNPLRSVCLVACLLAATVIASPSHHKKQGQQGPSPQERNENSLSNSLRPSEWLSLSQLESMPSVDQVSWAQLEEMSNNEGATLVNQLYHLSQINQDEPLRPDFRPTANDITAHIMQRNGEKKSVTLNQLAAKAKQESNFGNEEVTIFITGLPKSSKAASKATQKLIEAYQRRYNAQNQQQQRRHQYQQSQKQQHGQGQNDYDSASYEDYNDYSKMNSNNDYTDNQNQQSHNNHGNLVVIDLGDTLTSFKKLAMLDVDKTAKVIAKALVELTNQCNVPNEIIHVIGQGIGAHVAGGAGREYARQTGQKLRRITGLDPSKIYAKNPKTLTGLARGDAEFVDAIHTSAYGLGTQNRVGDVDFYPNGPSVAAPGCDNIVESSMRATRYFAESVVPGMEHNFPAVAASNLNEYRNNDGHGQRAYMGVKTDFDIEGDYILQVNAAAPFGKSSPAQKQINYHGVHRIGDMNSRSNNNESA